MRYVSVCVCVCVCVCVSVCVCLRDTMRVGNYKRKNSIYEGFSSTYACRHLLKPKVDSGNDLMCCLSFTEARSLN